MPYAIAWYIKDEILFVRFSGVLTGDDLRAYMKEAWSFVESSPRPLVHAINDVGDVVEPVSLIESLKVIRASEPHPRTGWSVNIREKSALVKMGAGFGSSVFKVRFKSVNTLDEAIAHLQFVDSALSWDKADASVVEGIPQSRPRD